MSLEYDRDLRDSPSLNQPMIAVKIGFGTLEGVLCMCNEYCMKLGVEQLY